MSASLLTGIVLLALLDSLSPVTITAVTLILVSGAHRPIRTAAVVVLGAASTVFAAGAVLFLSVGSAANAINGTVAVLRILAFGAMGVALVVAGIRRFRDRSRRSFSLPDWFTEWTALPLGVVITAADLPNAFPYFIAIERMVSAGVQPIVGLIILAGYAVLYCLPCLLLIAIGIVARKRIKLWLESIVVRLGTGTVKRSVPIGILLMALGIGISGLPLWLI